ncbi:3740_t:CDS:1, partial [Racocetra persica]
NENSLDVTLYICTCLDFKKRQLACKHIFAVLAQLSIDDNSINDNEC